MAEIAATLVVHVDNEVAGWLASEDIFETLALAFPELHLVAAHDVDLATHSDDCAVDAFYLPEAHGGPCVVYRRDVSQERLRFTLLHELAHHLLEGIAAELHDAIDLCAGPRGDCQSVEEAVCQSFAGQLLVPADAVATVLDGERLKPRHVIELHEQSKASWMAVAVRIADAVPGCCAIILMTEVGRVRFVAPSRAAFTSWNVWRTGSAVQPNGPLHTAFQRNAHCQEEIYRWSLGYAAVAFCDTQLLDDGMVVAVVSDKRALRISAGCDGR